MAFAGTGYISRIHALSAQKLPGGAEGLVNMRIVDAAYQSARTGRVVAL